MFIDYCKDYWSPEKVSESLSERMERGGLATWCHFCRCLVNWHAGALVPVLLCLLLVWFGLPYMPIPKKDIETPPESEVTRVMYSQKTAEGTREAEQVIKNTKPTTQPAEQIERLKKILKTQTELINDWK